MNKISFNLSQKNKELLLELLLSTLKQWDKDPQTKIYTPIFLDATCSGIQHFAGLLKDYDLG